MEDDDNSRQTDMGLECLIMIAAYYGIGIDRGRVVHDFNIQGRMADDKDLIRIARRVQLKAKSVSIKCGQLEKITLPAIMQLNNNEYAILLKIDKDKFLVACGKQLSPKVLAYDDLKDLFAGRVILIIPRKYKNRDIHFGLKWFLPTIVKYKEPLFEVLLAALVTQLLGIFSPMITQSVIDKVLTHNSLSTLDVLAVGLLLITIFESALSLARNYVFAHTTSKIDVILSCRLFQHLFHLPLRYFENRRVGDTIARVRELENIRRFLTGVPLNTLLDAMFIVVYIIIMYFYSIRLTNITLLSLPILAVLTAIITPFLKERLDEKFKAGADQQSYLVEAVNGVQTIKSFAIEPKVQQKWEGLLADYTVANFNTTILGSVAGTIAQFIERIFDILILYFGAKLVIEGVLTVGQMVAFRMLSSRVSQPVMRLVQMWQDFQQTSLSIKRLGDIFNSKPEPSINSVTSRLPKIKGNIVFDKVSFRYCPDGSQVIKNMSFHIPSDRVIGVVGRSGSGKSTISKLIQRLYVPESGKIMIDGVDLALADPTWLRRQIGVVLQESFLFNASIRDNIALQNPAAPMEDIIRVARIAGAHDFIVELADGYDTVVGERGTGLSGGQKQRIAIARALLSNPKILIFDEATSALDYESESIIQRNLQKICQNRTVIIIAHRLSTLKNADAIMVVDRGNIAEYGTSKDLIEKKGIYYHLLLQQQMNS